MGRFSQGEMRHVNRDANEYLFMSAENKQVASLQRAVKAVSMCRSTTTKISDNQSSGPRHLSNEREDAFQGEVIEWRSRTDHGW
jgi:hypothetical protein